MMATVKDVNVPTETLPEDYTWAEDYTGGVVKPPTTTQPEYIFAGDRGEEYESPAYIPEEIATNWASSFALPDMSWYRFAGNGSVPAPRVGSSTGQPTPPGANYPDWYLRELGRDDGGTVPAPTKPGQPTNPQTLITGKEERGLGWNFDQQWDPGGLALNPDLTFAGQGKEKGLAGQTVQGQVAPDYADRLRFSGLNQSQQAYADALNAAYAKSIWWQGALQDRENLDRIRMAMANNKPNVRTYDPRTLGGHIVGDLVNKPGGGGTSKKYYYGGGGGGGRGYSSYSSPASWFNALLSWRI